MFIVNIEQSPNTPTNTFSLFGLGFRPFFLLAGFAAIILMLIWLISWSVSQPSVTAYYDTIIWHAHEMLFGYIVAVTAGFLLTAVANWTGQRTVSGWPLGALAGLWLAGRIAPWLAGIIPPLMVAAFDLAFLPMFTWSLFKPLWTGRNRNNRWFIPLLLGMTLANAVIHAQTLGWTTTTAMPGIFAMLDLVILMLIFVGGRIMPFFTEKAILGAVPKRYELVERLSILLPIGMALLHLLQLPIEWSGTLALITGVLQGIRGWGWSDRRIWQIPILWVLYTGYAWLVIGLMLLGMNELGIFRQHFSSAIHTLTTGALGVFTLGMMARVALGHTGRMMRSKPPITIAFVLINLAAIVRILSPIIFPGRYLHGLWLAGLLWVVAFILFAVVYTPILLKIRADGKPDQ